MIERTDTGPVTVLNMSHGPVNVMDTEMVRGVTAAFTELAADPPGAVVLTGAGRAFSAGVDLRRFVDGGAGYVTDFLPALSEMFETVFAFGRPVVAAVNGHAIAGGCVLACCADVRLMATGRARIGVPEIKVGVAFPRVALEVMVHAIGGPAAGRLVLGAETHDPEQAVSLGLVDELVEPSGLLDRAVEVATGLATGIPGDTFAMTKAQLRRDATDRIARFRADEDPAIAELWTLRSSDGWTERYLESVTRKS